MAAKVGEATKGEGAKPVNPEQPKKTRTCMGSVCGFMGCLARAGGRSVTHGFYYGFMGAVSGFIKGTFLGGGFALGQMYDPTSNYIGFCDKNYSFDETYNLTTLDGYNCPSIPYSRVQDITQEFAGKYAGLYSPESYLYLTTAPVLVFAIGGAVVGGTLGGTYGVISGLFNWKARPKAAIPTEKEKAQEALIEELQDKLKAKEKGKEPDNTSTLAPKTESPSTVKKRK